MKSKLSEEDKEVIKKRILNGDTYLSIAKDYNIVNSEIAFMGHNMGIVRAKSHSSMKKWTVAKIDNFLIEHNSTIRRVSTDIRHCKTKAIWKCQLCGHEWEQEFESIARRILVRGGKGCIDCGYSGHTVYHDFLNNWTPLAAYFTGVFMATGTIHKNTVRISSRSKEKLEKIADIISCTYPIVQGKGNFFLSFRSTKISNILSAYKKNYKGSTIPDVIDNNLLPHFLRGYMDFHGFVEYFKSRQGTRQVRMTVTGNLSFLEALQSKYIEMTKKLNIGEKERVGFIRNNKHEFYITGIISAYHFMNWIYNSEVNPLRYVSDSKYNIYLELKQIYNQKADRRQYVIEKSKEYDYLLGEWNKTLSLTDITKKYGISFDQAKSISCGRAETSLPEDLRQKIVHDCIMRKQLKKQMRELQTRLYHKTGIERIHAAKAYKKWACQEL